MIVMALPAKRQRKASIKWNDVRFFCSMFDLAMFTP